MCTSHVPRITHCFRLPKSWGQATVFFRDSTRANRQGSAPLCVQSDREQLGNKTRAKTQAGGMLGKTYSAIIPSIGKDERSLIPQDELQLKLT